MNARFHGLSGRRFQENPHKASAQKKVQQGDGNAEKPYQLQARPKPLFDAVRLSGPDILGGKIGNAVADGGQGGDYQIIQFDRGGVSGHNGGAEGIDDPLNENVPYGNKALL